ncbi:hypothetical protein HPB51_024903 [Rhipicephalus microplus]|uniref:Uncharacterized protein n=1 Tax=Rhipicephalus microplus TaxID=6941 RepID=A0A9J6DKM8_RHIMP|nr:hypothetical protein HPB51_024903 [Rhipicephalus microplus]
MQQDVTLKKDKDTGVNVAVKVASKQKIAGVQGDANAGAEDDDEDATTTKFKDKKKKKKKKIRRKAESSSSSDDSDSDGDRSKSKKKATAGVSTRINIFTGAQGPQGIGMQSGMMGPNMLSNMAAPLPEIQQQLPLLPMLQQVPVAPKKDKSKRSTKSARSKSSQSKQSAPGMPAVIPPAMAGLVSGPDGQDVLVIPMPPGLKLPPFGAGANPLFGSGFPFADPHQLEQQHPKKKKNKSSEASESAAARSVASNTTLGQERPRPMVATGYPAPDAIAGVGTVVDDAAVEAVLQHTQKAMPPGKRHMDAPQGGDWEPSPSAVTTNELDQQSTTAQVASDASPSMWRARSEEGAEVREAEKTLTASGPAVALQEAALTSGTSLPVNIGAWSLAAQEHCASLNESRAKGRR